MQAEFIALSFATREVLWLRKMACETALLTPDISSKIYVDIQGCIGIVENSFLNDRTKHIDVKLNFVKDQVRDGTVVVQFVSSVEMAAHILTKILSVENHRENQLIIVMKSLQ